MKFKREILTGIMFISIGMDFALFILLTHHWLSFWENPGYILIGETNRIFILLELVLFAINLIGLIPIAVLVFKRYKFTNEYIK